MNINNPKNNIFVPADALERQREFARLTAELLPVAFDKPCPMAHVHTYGCQGNVADGERLKGLLALCGFALTDDVELADFVLFNTCAVREHAEDRIFGNVGRLKNLREKNPRMKIALCGCMMQQEHIADKIYKSYPYVSLVFGTHVVHRLPELLYRLLSGGKRVFEIPESDGVIAEGLPVSRDNALRAWLPVMYGCNNFCSYCIVPLVRGRERSRSPEAVLAEARELARAGYKDITLLGQNVNSYSGGMNFASLLRAVNDIDGDFTVRFMTSHPKDCTHELLDTMASCEKAARHLHLPFQSGSNRILREMNRGYTAEKYLGLLDYARSVMPDLSVTSDVIVGFPGETEKDFDETLRLVERADFTSLFTFIFSPREGTRAAALPDPTTRAEKNARFASLTAVQEKNAARRTAAMKGQTYRVLCEEPSKREGFVAGRTGGNVVIEFPADAQTVGSFVNVRVTSAQTWLVEGEII